MQTVASVLHQEIEADNRIGFNRTTGKQKPQYSNNQSAG